MVSSILSRQTGQVGSSTSDGVGGANGLVDRDLVAMAEESAAEDTLGDRAVDLPLTEGVKGSFPMSG